MIPQEHLDYMIQENPDLQGDESEFLKRFLEYGMALPVPEIPGLTHHMIGQVPGHDAPLEHFGPYGRRCKYMFIAVAPDYEDYACGRHFSNEETGPSAVLLDALVNAGFRLDECYFTTVMRFPRPPNATTYKQCWLRQGWLYAQEEIQVVRPDAVCFLGAETLKLARGNQSSLDSVRGQPFEFTTTRWRCPAMAVQSHMSFLSNTAGLPAFVRQLIMVKNLTNPGGADVLSGTAYPDRDYKILWNPDEISDAIDEEIRLGYATLAIDVETATDTGRPDHDYLVSFQWSHGPGHARCIPLLIERPEPVTEIVDAAGGKTSVPMYGGSGVAPKSKQDRVQHWQFAMAEIVRMLRVTKRLAGHNLRGDLIHLRKDSLELDEEHHFDIRPFMNKERMFDTMQAYHILEKDEYGLKQLTLRYTDMGAYDAPMNDWVLRNGGKGKLFPGNRAERFFHGFRDICYKFLLPYAMCDPDATIRLVPIFEQRLAHPANVMLSALYYDTLIPLNSALVDIEGYGLPVDELRAEQLSYLYTRKHDQLLQEFRDFVNWPNFNTNSTRQVCALMYDGPYKDSDKAEAAVPKLDDGRVPVRLHMFPPWTTGKFGKNWEDIAGEESYHSPSTEGKALKKLLTSTKGLSEGHREVLQKLCEIRDLKNFCSNFMREPVLHDVGGVPYPVYGKGLRGCILDDKRIKTQISTLAETHRWKHRKPNLANLPKDKEKNIAALFAAHMDEEDKDVISSIDDGAVTLKDGKEVIKIPKIRSIFVAGNGYAIIEADYKSAELWVMGLLSGDAEFCRVLREEPDMHLCNAREIFQLDFGDLDPHKPEDLAKLKKKFKDPRFAIKAVCFGIAYGLASSGLADQLSLEFGRYVSVEEAQSIIDGYFKKYPGLKRFFEQCAMDVEVKGYVETPFGSRRYFPGFHRVGRKQQAKMKREGMNAVIQGTVAILLDKASVLLDQMRYDTGFGRRAAWEYCLAIHDAMMIRCREEVAPVVAQAVKWAMEAVVIPGHQNLQVDVDILQRWGTE